MQNTNIYQKKPIKQISRITPAHYIIIYFIDLLQNGLIAISIYLKEFHDFNFLHDFFVLQSGRIPYNDITSIVLLPFVVGKTDVERNI
jgi:hypothetical protein